MENKTENEEKNIKESNMLKYVGYAYIATVAINLNYFCFRGTGIFGSFGPDFGGYLAVFFMCAYGILGLLAGILIAIKIVHLPAFQHAKIFLRVVSGICAGISVFFVSVVGGFFAGIFVAGV